MIKKFKEFVAEASEQAKLNKRKKNMRDTFRGARHQLNSPTPLDHEEEGYKRAADMNKAIGRALRREEVVVESNVDHSAKAAEFKKKADKLKSGTEPYFSAMSSHHYHAGHAARAAGDEDAAREHFTNSYSYGHKDRADRKN